MGNLTVKKSGEMVNIISPNVNNITSFKVHFSPKQEGTGDPSPENVREIVGWNGVEEYKCGKNLFDYAHANILDRHIKNDNGVSVSDGGNSYCQIYIPVMPNTTYTLSGLSNEKALAKRIYYYDKDKQWISRTNGSTKTSFTITTPSNCRYIQIQSERQEYQDWSTVQVELGNTATKFEPYKYGTVLMDWTDTIGNIYGGYVDLVTGEIYKNYEQVIFNGTIRWNGITNYDNANRFIYIKKFLPLLPQNNATCYFNYLTNILGGGQIGNGFIGSTGNVLIYTDKNIDSIDSLMEYQTNNPLQLIYKLETPILVATLSPTQLSTLKGQNNFWSNADYIEIEYELTETFDIQKAKRKIILNQPHVESVSGDLVTFDTDMKGKLKECKVYFSPVQEGEGDPSPDNVREIKGWNGVNIGLPDEYQEVEWIQSTEEKQFILLPYGFEETDTVTITANIDTEYANDKFIIAPTTWNNNKNRFAMAGVYASTYCIGYGNHLTNTTFLKPNTKKDGDMHTWTFANKVFEITDLGLSIDVSDITFGGVTSNLKLFYGYNRNTNGKLSYYKHVKLNGEVYEFIPCYRKSDGEIGLYDIKNHVFYTNDGTGSFLKGKDVNNITASINWKDEAGNVYGEYVDLVSGELVVNRAMVDLGTLDYVYQPNLPRFYTKQLTNIINTPSRNDIPANIICSIYKTGVVPSSGTPDGEISVAVSGNMFIKDTRYTDATSFKEAMSGVQLCYELAEPIHYQLTPQQLITFKGTNNVYSDTNGQMEIKYWKH